MNQRNWLNDTIARRFAIAIVSSIGFTFLLIGLFIAIGGVWGRQPLNTSALPKEAADMARIIQAAPPASRQALAEAARTPTIWADWYPTPSATAIKLSAAPRRDTSDFAKLVFAPSHARSITVGYAREIIPASAFTRASARRPTDPFLGVQFSDQSWLVFTALRRTWGLTKTQQWGIWLLFLGVSIPLHSMRAARRLSLPVEQLAEAARLFGANPDAPPLEEKGPLEIRQVIRTFNEMQARIQRFVAHRTTMLAAISHDLRTPLTRIRLRGELIDDQEQQARLFRDVDEMQTMIDGALAFFQDDAVSEGVTAFDLAGLLCTIVDDYADQGIEVRYVGPPRAIYRGRPFALKRAVTNLVENAVKYASPPEILLDVSPLSAMAIVITDAGPGIPAASLELVFSPYYRIDKSRSRKTGGVGLGLTAAQAIVQGHGGTIDLKNLGSGLEARVTLPPQG